MPKGVYCSVRPRRSQPLIWINSPASRKHSSPADPDALGIDPSVFGHVLHGNYGGAVRSLIHAGSNAVTGNNPKARVALADGGLTADEAIARVDALRRLEALAYQPGAPPRILSVAAHGTVRSTRNPCENGPFTQRLPPRQQPFARSRTS